MGRVTTLTSKGQVTIPKAIRDELGLRPHDKIEFFIEHGRVRFRKAFPSLDEVAGSLPVLGMDVDEAITLAKEERTQKIIEKTKNG